MGFLKDTKSHFSFFGRKGKQKLNPKNEEPEEKTSHKKSKKINPNELMDSVLDETVPEAALTEMSRVPKLRAHDPEDETKPMYIGMMLNAQDIGGINKRRHKDRTIGQLIEAINAGDIKTYIPSDLMMQQKLVIIPTPATLDVMGDFGILTNSKLKYELVVIIPNGTGGADIGFADKPQYISYQTMVDYIANDDTNTPNEFLDQFDFFAEDDNANKAKDDEAKAKAESPNDVLTDNLPDNATQTSDDNSVPEIANDGEDANSEESNFTDSDAPFSLGEPETEVPGEDNLANTDPRERDNSGDVDVPDSDNYDKQDATDPNDALVDPDNGNDFATNNEESDDEAKQESDQSVNDMLANDENNDFAENSDAGNDFASNAEPVEQTENTNDFAENSEDLDAEDHEQTNDQDKSDFAMQDQDKSAEDQNKSAEDEANVQMASSKEDLDQAIERRFYGNNLNLKVSTKPIDMLLLQNNEIVPFDVDRGDGFLNQYLNQMSREANQSMQRKHHDNIAATRSYWYNLVVKGVEDIITKVDDTNENTEYGKQKANLDADRASLIDKTKLDVKKKQDELDKHLLDAAEADAKRAADQARQDYLDRFKGKTEANKEKLMSDALDKINVVYNDKIDELHTRENTHASQMYDQVVSESTTMAMNYYKKLRNNEHKNEADWRRKLRTYTDHHRKEQVAHDKALQAEIDQEIESKKQQKEFDKHLSNLQAQMKIQKRDADNHIAQLEQENAQNMAKLRREKKELKDQYEQELSDRDLKHNRQLDKMKREYETKLSSLREDKQEEVAKLNNTHAEDVAKLKREQEVTLDRQKQHDLDKINDLKSQMIELSRQVKKSKDEKDDYVQDLKRQISQKNDLVKNLRDEIVDLNDNLSHVQASAEGNLRREMEAKYSGQLSAAQNNADNLKSELERQRDEMKDVKRDLRDAENKNTNSRSSMHSMAAIAATIGLIFGIGGTMLMQQRQPANAQNQDTVSRESVDRQVRKAQDEQRKRDNDRIDKAVSQAVAKVQAQDKAKAEAKAKAKAKAKVKNKTQNQNSQNNQSSQNNNSANSNSNN